MDSISFFYVFAGTELTDGAVIDYTCACDEGYIWNDDSGFCDVQLCADSNAFCRNGGSCVDGAISSTCDCPAGTTGVNCETVDYCYSIDCNNGQCVSHEHEHECVCVDGWNGETCNVQVCGETGCHNNGICG